MRIPEKTYFAPMDTYFISGIGTDVGKTIVSAVLVEKLKANYWKPVQTGASLDSDTERVRSLVSNAESQFFEESVRLEAPLSPHEAAALEGQEIHLSDLKKPASNRTLIIEGAGGLMVPLNSRLMMAELVDYFGAKLILVSRNYLGSINHTLLSLQLISQWKIPLHGIIFTGEPNVSTQEMILTYSGVKSLGFMPLLDQITKDSIKRSVNCITI